MDTRYVFDLDNTLIKTDYLNNTSYNHALTQLGFPQLSGFSRITRTIVCENMSFLSTYQINQIIELKQAYFLENLHLTQVNKELMNKLLSYEAQNCILWTSADNNRVVGILAYYKLLGNFATILYSDKKNVSEDVKKICSFLKCTFRQLLFFEDNEEIVSALKRLKLNVCTGD